MEETQAVPGSKLCCVHLRKLYSLSDNEVLTCNSGEGTGNYLFIQKVFLQCLLEQATLSSLGTESRFHQLTANT